MTFCIMAEFRYAVYRCAECHYAPNVTSKPFVLSVIMLSVNRLNVMMLSVVVPFVHVNPFQPSLIFVAKARSIPWRVLPDLSRLLHFLRNLRML